MLTTTAQQLHASNLGETQSGQQTDYDATVSTADVGNNAQTIRVIPRGQVFLITQIVVQADQTTGGFFTAWTPNNIAFEQAGVSFNDASVTRQGAALFMAARRQQADFDSGNTPSWRNAPPGNVIKWTPKYAIPVPSGWRVMVDAAGEFASRASVYGMMVDEDSARTLGYSVSTTATDADRRYGMVNSSGTASATTIIAGRTGQSIRILDMHIRMQTATFATNTLTLQQVDGRKVLEMSASSMADVQEHAFSPGIFLKSGQGLQIQTTAANTVSVNISYEFVDEDEVPGNHWWACVNPAYPSPGTNVVQNPLNPPGSNIAVGRESTAITVYYPRRDVTATVALGRDQHVLSGYAVSILKDSTTNPVQTLLTISAGTADGNIRLDSRSSTALQTNYQLSNVYGASGHDQSVVSVIDQIRVPAGPANGLYVDTMSLGPHTSFGLAATPADATANVEHWAVTVWGYTDGDINSFPQNRGV